jgi:L-ascorbate metabolism protein UlaG (beta-lactamase superfamily)
MRLTKQGHACVWLEKEGARLVIDPGVWSGPRCLEAATAVLVSHEHPDHLNAAALRDALALDADLQVWASSAVAAQFADAGDRVHAVHDGDTFAVAGFDVHVYGADHARVDSAVPIVPNTGFAVDGQVFHPGDSFTVPQEDIPTLLVPVSGPWLKFADVADYLRAVAPRQAYWIHDELLNEKGASLFTSLFQLVPAQSGPALHLSHGASIEL